MTRFIHDQFAKDLLEELLAPLGEVQAARRVRSEVREIDVWFSPRPHTGIAPESLGLLGEFARTPASFEPFRNAVGENEMCDCLLKLLVLRGEILRQTRRDNADITDSDLPKLWVLTPTASERFLHSFHAIPNLDLCSGGVYSLGTALRSAIVVIHQLPKTPETLWLRILGKGKVQQEAIDELEALDPDSPFRANALELLLNLRITLETRQDPDIDQDDKELLMRLSPLYRQRIEEATQQGVQQGLQQGIQQYRQRLEEATQQGVQQGIQQGVQQGLQQGERLVIENLLKVRFGAIDDRLGRVIESLLTLTPEEFTPLLIHLSRDELIERFGGDDTNVTNGTNGTNGTNA